MNYLKAFALVFTIGIVGTSPAFIKSRYFAFVVGGPTAYARVAKNAARAEYCNATIPDEKFVAKEYRACLEGN
jgi:hypothetical protein